ncbi:hypothetical protein [Amycolatopsis palatopharyngis]|uniref:hypothetical protein n=1 Tax=Amycolatopsis palatopharyngis TaxID=187982 RepID=UPI000E22EBD1|nr:hypothetical protein [Amycolatopsis palatopharyngis]
MLNLAHSAVGQRLLPGVSVHSHRQNQQRAPQAFYDRIPAQVAHSVHDHVPVLPQNSIEHGSTLSPAREGSILLGELLVADQARIPFDLNLPGRLAVTDVGLGRARLDATQRTVRQHHVVFGYQSLPVAPLRSTQRLAHVLLCSIVLINIVWE